MPPRSHSSSSHSSHHSSRSSFRSSSSRSSHSSSRSSSSYSSSGPSRHSSSSHTSSSASIGRGITAGAAGAAAHSASTHYSAFANNRTRVNQPKGFRAQHRIHVNRYRCTLHDYDYYPVDWTENGVTYKKGYYDENGERYDAVAFQDEPTELQCPYCGSHNKIVWKSGPLPKCPNCGGEYEKVATDTIESTNFTGSDNTTTGSRSNTQGLSNTRRLVLIIFLVVGVFLVACFAAIGFTVRSVHNDVSEIMNNLPETEGIGSGNDDSNYFSSDDFTGNSSALPESITVLETGHTCYYDGENYYDAETGCYFWFNTDLDPAQWQYWYEDVSSHFGDYGWMEYDDDAKEWYIETENGWIVLPDEYNTPALWHFVDAYDGSILEQ